MQKILGIALVLASFCQPASAQQQQTSGFMIGGDGTVTTFDNGSGFSVGPQGTSSWDATGGYQVGPGGTGSWTGPVQIAPQPYGQPQIILPEEGSE
jgi:uncharacterized membrane protein